MEAINMKKMEADYKLAISDENEFDKPLYYYTPEVSYYVGSIKHTMPEPVLPENVEYFGYILSNYKSSLSGIIPRIRYDINGEDGFGYDFDVESFQDLNFEKPLPLIFKKITNEDGSCQLAQEIISGKIVRIYDETELWDVLSPTVPGEIMYFQNHEKEFREHPLVITALDGVICVNGQYKELVAKETRGYESKIKEIFNKCEIKAKERFDQVYHEQIDKLHDLAFVDNLIIDSSKKIK